jgi:hypothetical protein
MLAIVQMEWRGQSLSISRAEELDCRAPILFDPWSSERPAALSASRLLDLRQAHAFVQINRDEQSRALRRRHVKVLGIDDTIAANHANVDYSASQQKYA